MSARFPWVAKPLGGVEIVDTLERLDLLELAGESPWPDLSDDDEAYPIDWAELASDDPEHSGLEDTLAPNRNWDSVGEELRGRMMRKGGGEPPPVLVDYAAWYQPIHYFGHSWGIFIREEAVLELATYLLFHLPEGRQQDLDALLGVVRIALGVLYLHESFHHKMESFGIRLEIVERERRYCAYQEQVYRPLRDAQSDDLLEEALATAESCRRLREAVYRRGVPKDVEKVARPALGQWINSLPPGYRQGGIYLSDGAFDEALNTLSSQLHEASLSPSRDSSDWRLAPHIHRGLFNCHADTWIVVPVGTRPIVPWFGAGALPFSISSRELEKTLRSHGYRQVSGGKGSHVKYKADGRPTLIVPGDRESVTPGVLRCVATALGLPSIEALRL